MARFRTLLLILIILLACLLGAWWAYRWLMPVPAPVPAQQPPSAPEPVSSVVLDPAVRQVRAPAPLLELPVYNPGHRPPVGINVNELHHEDASFPFVDLFRQADPFQDNILALDSDGVEYDADGWPIRLNGKEAGTKFIGKMPPQALYAGDYVLLYDGQGELRYGPGVERVSAEPGRELLRFYPGEDGEINAALVITRSLEQDPLRNIRILPPGGICRYNPVWYVNDAAACEEPQQYLDFEHYYNSIVFNPDYLDFIKPFSTLRFMAMSGITRNPEQHWDERPNLQEATWGGGYGERGAPLEIQVALANRMHNDAWFNLPHAADDDYVRRFATYVRDHLDAGLNIYVEYTNEVWNTAFSHSEYTQKKGIEAGYSINSVEAGFQYYVQRAGEVFAIWEDVFGGRERFTRVLGSWDTRPDISRRLLGQYGGYKQADAIAIAPYFGGNIKGYREAQTVDRIFDLTTAPDSFRSLAQVVDHVREQAEVAREYGRRLLAYEGGQGLVDWVTREPDQHPNPLFFAANRDPRMGPLYTELLQGWKDAGGDLFVTFASPRTCQWFGCWGLKEYIRQPVETAYKYAAVLDFIHSHEDWQLQHNKTGPEPEQVAAQAQSDAARHERAPDDPVIVFRPANDPERYFFLENPRTLDTLISGSTWAKRNLFGKWQGKWDKDYLYLTVRVYDENRVADSDDPTQDDSIEVYIDADNSRLPHYDGKNDFRLIFAWGRDKVYIDPKSPPDTTDEGLDFDMQATEDGYELQARIPWKMLRTEVDVRHRLGVEIEVNDDDDGGEREQKISWLAREDNAMNDPRLFGVVLISGR